MRFFLAQSALLGDYKALQTRFAPCLRGRWRGETSLHATVLFLGGRFEAAQIIETVSRCDIVLEDAPLSGIGRFAHNRIFYAASAHPTLVETYNRLSRAFGMEHQHPYIPHVTLMRYKWIDTACFDTEADLLAQRTLGTIGGPLKLMKSTLTPEGAVYEPVHQF